MAARPPTFTPSRAPHPSRAARHAPPPERSRLKRVLRWALWLIVPMLAVIAGSLVGLVSAFDKRPAKKLTLAQSALLAGSIRAPEFYSKKQNFTSTKARRDFVLRVMEERGWITQKQAAAAIKTPVRESSTVPSSGIAESKAPYFLEKVRQYLLDKYGATRLAQ